MRDTKEVMDNFMNKLKNACFDRDSQPNNGPQITEQFINEKLSTYERLLDTSVFKCAINK